MLSRAERETQAVYRRVFGTKEGQWVLGHLLTDMHFFNTTENEKEQVLSNYARVLLKRLGILNGQTIEEVVASFMKIHPKDD